MGSAPGKGTVFKVYLPQAAPCPEAGNPGGFPVGSFKGTATILVVDDDIHIRDVSRRMLNQAGFTVLEAGNGGEALDICRKHAGPIHLILTDVVMPGMSSPELAEQLSALWPEFKVIFMSGYTDHVVLKAGMTEMAGTFIQKPFSPAALLQTIKKALS